MSKALYLSKTNDLIMQYIPKIVMLYKIGLIISERFSIQSKMEKLKDILNR